MVNILDTKYMLTSMSRLRVPLSRAHLTISAIPSTLITSCTSRIDSTDWIDFLILAIAKSQVDIRAPIDFSAGTKVARWLFINVVGNDDRNLEGSPFIRGFSARESCYALSQRLALVSRHAQLSNQFFTYHITCK
jgi:hypothetical protein